MPHPADMQKYLGLMRSGPWFHSLPEPLQSQLEKLAVPQRLDGGQRLFARGDPFSGLYCVVEGAVRITGLSATGKEALLSFIEPPHWFGEIALFDGQARTHDAWAEGPVVLLHIPQAPLHALLAQEPACWREFGALLTQKMRAAFMALEDWAILPAAGRLARRLVTIAEGYGAWKDRTRRVIQIPQEQLALMLSLSRQTVNQTLRQWEAQGVLRLSRGGIEILDIDALRGFARE